MKPSRSPHRRATLPHSPPSNTPAPFARFPSDQRGMRSPQETCAVDPWPRRLPQPQQQNRVASPAEAGRAARRLGDLRPAERGPRRPPRREGAAEEEEGAPEEARRPLPQRSPEGGEAASRRPGGATGGGARAGGGGAAAAATSRTRPPSQRPRRRALRAAAAEGAGAAGGPTTCPRRARPRRTGPP